MSLLSPEALTAYIGPGDVVVVHRRGWRRTIAGGHILACAAAEANGKSDKPAYIAVAAALRGILAETGARRLDIVVSNHWVHYMVHAWRDDAADNEEQSLLARMRFTEIYGPVADNWQVVMSDEAPGRPRLAAAIDGMLLGMLNDVATESGVTLNRVQPLLIGIANAALGQYGQRGQKWIAVHESGRLTLALLDGATWVWTRSQRVAVDWTNNFAGLLAQEALLAGQDESTEAIIFAPLVSGKAIAARPGQLAHLLAAPPFVGDGLGRPDPRFGYPLVFP
ncbi:hypothetical protein [Dechloromonas sp. HYN0024]|uniref:hypothetical protein n=1 Tax=Dechloromonas sp. HYN0024 TaxID=2231055 RepID=UPI0013C33ED4|nr:hypothetical protein [Dechloromonas sp. HYN0024]